MVHASFLICKFDKPTLSNIIRERFGTGFPDIFQKPQINFAYSYLNELKARTILLETDYVDRDYLEDYSQYYVRCFSRYGERCARLHFFDDGGDDTFQISHEQIREGLTAGPIQLEAELQKRYLGFIVIKPIPRTFIGKSCLKLYPWLATNKTKKVIANEYTVNLFGMKLTVNSVAFQEQDKVVSACATTAIWSLMHAQKQSYRLPETPSASRITLAAINHIENSSNSFPNGGLNIKQIMRAFDVYGFRTHQVDLKKDSSESAFFDTVRYHIKSKIPLILGGAVYKIEDGKAIYEGNHAVTVLGYKEHPDNKALYVHDDRFGPYARTLIRNISSYLTELKVTDASGRQGVDWAIFFQEKSDTEDSKNDWDEKPRQFIVPDNLMLVTHPKVRIQSLYISNTCELVVEQLARYFKELAVNSKELELTQVNYDIELVGLTDFRYRVAQATDVLHRYKILTTNTPKYVWLASFYVEKGATAFEIAFDATDIPQGDAVKHVVFRSEKWEYLLKDSMKDLNEYSEPVSDTSEHFYHSVIKHLTDSRDDLWSYLDEQFGELRAPNLVKQHELSDGDLNNQTPQTFYGRISASISDKLPEAQLDDPYIWVIGLDGALHLGKEIDGKGHPTIAAFKSARISGEISKTEKGWKLIPKSGRYSGDYGEKQGKYLENAKQKFLEVFGLEEEKNIYTETKAP